MGYWCGVIGGLLLVCYFEVGVVADSICCVFACVVLVWLFLFEGCS